MRWISAQTRLRSFLKMPIQVRFEHASGMLTIFSTFEASGQPLLRTGEIELRGTKGALYATMNRVEIVPEEGGRFQDKRPRREPLVLENHDGYKELDQAHARNFLDCVKSRSKPNCDIEEGHRSTIYALLANILKRHRVGLFHIVFFHNRGESPEALVSRFPSLPPELVKEVIAFYETNRDEVNAYVAECQAEIDRQRATTPEGLSLSELRKSNDPT